MNIAVSTYSAGSLHTFTAPPPPVVPLPVTAPSTGSRRSRPKQRPTTARERANDGTPSAHATEVATLRAVALDDREEVPALWHGAWVGWLACQTALLVMVESTPLGSRAGLAMALRTVVLGLFVVGFRKACFPTAFGRVVFAWCVIAAEGVIAAVCNRWSVVTGWPLVTAMALPLFASHQSLRTLFTINRAFALKTLEVCHLLLAYASRGLAALGPALFRHAPNTLGARVWGICLNGVEQTRQVCAHAVNRRRSTDFNQRPSASRC